MIPRAAHGAGSALALALLLAPLDPAWGASEGAGEHTAESLKLLVIAILNFVILLGVLWRYAWQPIKFFLFQRSETVRAALTASQKRLAEAQAQILALEQRLASLGREAQQLIDSAQRQAEEERERMERRAEEAAQRIRHETERVAEVEIQRARQALREEAVALAESLAAELIRERLGPEDDARLIEEFTTRVERATH